MSLIGLVDDMQYKHPKTCISVLVGIVIFVIQKFCVSIYIDNQQLFLQSYELFLHILYAHIDYPPNIKNFLDIILFLI
jgi:hypothetical protein